MAHKFVVTIPPSLTASQLFDQLMENASESGADFRGNAETGTFSMKGVVGSYTVSGSKISITINKKPFIVTNTYIEKKVREFFS